MKLEELGFNNELREYRKNHNLESFEVGRVAAEHKERYIVKTEKGELEGEIIGNLRFTAQSRSDFPAVGDWVSISEYDEDKVLIHSIYPRRSIIERQAVGKQGEKQIIATNIDVALIMQAVDRDFNINRIERYLTICHNSGVIPIIILNKIDLISISETTIMENSIAERIPNIRIIKTSNETKEGLNKILELIEKGKTYCLLGSSGVGKSSLVNSLTGRYIAKTNDISTSTNRGKHITTSRELFVLENGGIIIDNPGMREVGVADSDAGLQATFEKIIEISKNCKYADCTHTNEDGCSVIIAVDSGEIDNISYNNYLTLEREKEHFESTVAERRKKDKDFGKMVKEFKKIKSKNKFR